MTDAEETPRLPWSQRLFFLFVALVGLLGIVSRFDEVRAMTPSLVAMALLLVQGPLLVMMGFLEARTVPAESNVDLPEWMTVRSRSVRAALTFSFTFLALVLMQEYEIGIGEIDPTPPAVFSLQGRVGYFAMFTVGMGFINFIAASGLLLPVLRTLARPFRRWPLSGALPVALVLGCALSAGMYFLFRLPIVDEGLRTVGAFSNSTQGGVLLVVVPLVLGSLLSRRS